MDPSNRNFTVNSFHFSLEEQVLSRFEEENGGQLVVATVCLLETSRHGLLESELLELLADENNLTPTEYKPGDDEPCSTKVEKTSTDATDALADKLQEQVNITYVQTSETDAEKKSSKESGKGWSICYR